MRLAAKNILYTAGLIFGLWQIAVSQDLTRDLSVSAGDTIEIINKSGRVAARAVVGDQVKASLTASSVNGVSDSEIIVNSGGGRVLITVAAADKQKRIDLVLILPERLNIKIETLAGAVEAAGNFALIQAKTDTGTVAVDVPTDDLKYQFQWTESRPRYLADFDIAKVKEKAAGRFEVKGRRSGEVKSEKLKVKSEETDLESKVQSPKSKEPETQDQKPKTVSLYFTTARGIILLNVPPNEVTSDLRERPLTEAAKAIVRSGDSLLMEAIRRASPKYFGDYARTLPPLRREPSFAARTGELVVPSGSMKMASVSLLSLPQMANG